jgi:hypothetical protein
MIKNADHDPQGTDRVAFGSLSDRRRGGTASEKGPEMNRIISRVVLPIVAAGALGGTGFAFMAQNVQQASSLGTSTNSVNGYDVNDIHYLACAPLNGQFCSVQFKLVPRNGAAPANSGSNVQASVNNDAFQYCRYDGAPGSNQGTLWTCNFSHAAADVTSLNISAAQ